MVGKNINNYELRENDGDRRHRRFVHPAEHPVLRRRVAVKLLKRQYLESPSPGLAFHQRGARLRPPFTIRT